MSNLARRLPTVSDFARPYVEPEPIEAEYEEKAPPSKPTLMDRVRSEQTKYSESARLARRNSWWNGLGGWACMLLSFLRLPQPLGTVLFWAAVLLWALAFYQWMTFIVDRKAARMYPDPADLSL